MQRRALVTGAGGFIGHHLVRRLIDDGWDVAAFVRYTSTGSRGLLETLPGTYATSYRPLFGDLRDSDAVRRAMTGCDVVFHLGALIGIPYSYVNPREVADVNVGGTLNVLEAAKALGTLQRIVVTSTSEVYGTAQTPFIAESHPLNAQSPYAATKAGADHLALSYFRAFDLPVTICRPFNTFGPGQSARAIVPTIILQALSASRLELGSLTATRDMNYVDNTVEAFLAVACSDRAIGESFHFGSGVEVSILELAHKVLALLGTADRTQVVSTAERVRPEKSEVHRLLADAERARQILNWRPRVSLEDGLERTIAWIKSHRERYHAEGYAV
jgi:NAD dependent epimerase/dehydratase